MTKHVFSPASQVAHVWAQRSQGWGKSSHGNFHFDGTTIYSYSQPIGRFYDSNDGMGAVVLIDNGSWSVTTRKHQRLVERATSQYRQFFAPNSEWRLGRPNDASFHEGMLGYFLRSAEVSVKAAARARTRKDQHLERATDLIRQHNDWIAAFALDMPLARAEDVSTSLAAWNASRDARQAAERERRQREHDEIVADQTKRLAEWLADPNVRTTDFYAIPVALRVVSGPDEPEVQTSHGARFPLTHAVRAFRLLRATIGGENVPEGFTGWSAYTSGHVVRLGHFQIDRIEYDGTVVAGCHRVPWAAVWRLAKTLDLV
jgi:hypothetical protein